MKGIGLGLEALIPPKYKKPEGERLFPKESIFLIEVDKIKPNPFQPRKEFNEDSLKELAQSIKEFGVLQPLIVTKLEKEVPGGQEVEYYLVAGERRLRAAKMVGIPRVPVVIRQTQYQERLEISLIENVQRENLNPIEKAQAFKKLVEEFKFTQREIALKVSQSREAVANTLRLLDLPEDIQKEVLEGRLSEGHARAILSIRDEKKQKSLLKEILDKRISVRKAESIAQSARGIFKPFRKELADFVQELTNILNSKFRLTKNLKGELILTIKFSHEDSLKKFIKRFK